MLLNYGVGEDSWEPLGLQQSSRKPVLNIHWKDWCWSWNSTILATWWEELTHLKRPWCWERLKAGGEEEDRRWDGWMASLTQWAWVRVNSRNWLWTGKPGVLQSMASQRVAHDWVTELYWTLQKWAHQPAEVCQFLASSAKCWGSQCHFREFWREDPQDK